MITIKTKYRDELKSFLEEMGCEIGKTGGDMVPMTEVTHPSRHGGKTTSYITLYDLDGLYIIEIKSTVGFEQKLLRKARKRTINLKHVGMIKVFQVAYWGGDDSPPTAEEWEKIAQAEEELWKFLENQPPRSSVSEDPEKIVEEKEESD